MKKSKKYFVFGLISLLILMFLTNSFSLQRPNLCNSVTPEQCIPFIFSLFTILILGSIFISFKKPKIGGPIILLLSILLLLSKIFMFYYTIVWALIAGGLATISTILFNLLSLACLIFLIKLGYDLTKNKVKF